MNEVALRQGIEARKRPLNEVMAALLEAGRDEHLATELCLQLDIFCCTLHAATTGVLSWTLPSPDVHYGLEGHPQMWRPPQMQYVELDHALRDDHHIRWMMELSQQLTDFTLNHGRIPVIVTERQYSISHWNASGAEYTGNVAIRHYESLQSGWYERQQDLLALMCDVSDDVYSKCLAVLKSGIEPKTEVEKRLKQLCEYLARFYQYAVADGFWRGNPWEKSHRANAPQIGNQGMERFDV